MDKKEEKKPLHIKVQNKNREVLKKYFPHCFDKNGYFDIARFESEISETKINFSKESYGLDWLGKSYARLLAGDEASTLLQEEEAFNRQEKNRDSENLLIKGDNLEVLKHLSHAYHHKIKMIYIDPPYNTGSDGFVYQDNRKFTTRQLAHLAGTDEEKAKKIMAFVNSKSNSHSAWLTFMYPRLYIAKHLLQDDGVIFVSIDDHEVAQLRLLMDEIFGEEHFVGNFIWQTKNAARGVPPRNMLMENHEYILCYARNANHHTFAGIERDASDFQNRDHDPRGLWRSESIRATGLQNNYFTITDPGTKNEFYGNWAFNQKTIKRMIEEGLILFPKKKNGTPRQKKFLDSYTHSKKAFVTSLGWFSTENSTKYLMSLFDNRKIFDFPKPVELIKFLVKQQTQNGDLILDFFAGSGTTGDAVMQLNAEEGTHRRFILVQLPEPIDPKKNKTAYTLIKENPGVEVPSIFEITRKRLLRAAKKIKEDITGVIIAGKVKEIKKIKRSPGSDSKEKKIRQLKAEIAAYTDQDLGFKVFETIPSREDRNMETGVSDADQPILVNKNIPTRDQLKALLITWKTYDGTPLTRDLQEIDLGGYTAYYADGKLYLTEAGFTDANLKALLERMDRDKFIPDSIIALGSHFKREVLRKISKNIKSFANKKNLDIVFMTRQWPG